MLNIKLDKKFKKDVKRDKKSGKYSQNDFNEFKYIMDCLIDNIKLDEKYLNHKLIGDYKNYSECHIKPNWLLIYKINDDTIKFARLGTHQQLFKNF